MADNSYIRQCHPLDTSSRHLQHLLFPFVGLINKTDAWDTSGRVTSGSPGGGEGGGICLKISVKHARMVQADFVEFTEQKTRESEARNGYARRNSELLLLAYRPGLACLRPVFGYFGITSDLSGYPATPNPKLPVSNRLLWISACVPTDFPLLYVKVL